MNAISAGRVVILGLALSTACGKDKREAPPTPAPSASTGAVQVAIGGGSRKAKDGSVPFTITDVHEKVARSDAVPWWKAGGDWTFFDAKTEDGAAFTIGVKETRRLTSGDMPMILEETVIAASDADAGDKLTRALAKGLAAPEPPQPAKKGGSSQALDGSGVVLGENQTRTAEGSFASAGGGWTASKWTFEDADGFCEIYVNYNLTTKTGELARKSSEHDADFVKRVAAALRDGKPPKK